MTTLKELKKEVAKIAKVAKKEYEAELKDGNEYGLGVAEAVAGSWEHFSKMLKEVKE